MAVIAPSYDTKRTNLRDVIPLAAPYTIQVEPTRFCNFRCFFCMHHSRGTKNDLLKESGLKLMNMDMELFDKFVENVMEFKTPPKMINFCGIGEPFMNPDFSEMVRRLRSAGYGGRIITYSNGALLTPQLSDEIVDSGLSEIRISLNGLTSGMFKKVTGATLDMERYVDNIRYLYEHKRGTKVYIKIIENLLEDEKQQEVFYDTFRDISDVMYIEHIIQLQRQMKDYDGIVTENQKNVFNEPIPNEWKTCSCMFYQMHVDAEGYVFFCVSLGNPSKYAVANIKDESLKEIWDGEKRRRLLEINLKDGSDVIPMCAGCEGKYDITAKEEYLDDCSEMLLERLKRT